MAFDAPQSESYRFLGRMLASSLLRTFFTGDIVIFRNSPAPLFLVERKGLDEVILVIGHWSFVIGAEASNRGLALRVSSVQ